MTQEQNRQARIAANSQRWRDKHPELAREYSRKQYAKNPARHLAAGRKWRERAKLADPQYWRKYQQRAGIAPPATRPCPETCECCGKPPSGKQALHLDHDHKTGKFRGWLCQKCNHGLGLFGDDFAGVQNAVKYLQLAEGVKP